MLIGSALRMAAYALLCYFLVGTSNSEGGQSDEKVVLGCYTAGFASLRQP